jgi:hypothetical protein
VRAGDPAPTVSFAALETVKIVEPGITLVKIVNNSGRGTCGTCAQMSDSAERNAVHGVMPRRGGPWRCSASQEIVKIVGPSTYLGLARHGSLFFLTLPAPTCSWNRASSPRGEHEFPGERTDRHERLP